MSIATAPVSVRSLVLNSTILRRVLDVRLKVSNSISLENFHLISGSNLGVSLKRAEDTRWRSHYGTLLSLIGLFSPIIDVLKVTGEDATYTYQRNEVSILLYDMQYFEFVFMLHLMKKS